MVQERSCSGACMTLQERVYNSYSTPHRSLPTGKGLLKHTLHTLIHFTATAASLII